MKGKSPRIRWFRLQNLPRLHCVLNWTAAVGEYYYADPSHSSVFSTRTTFVFRHRRRLRISVWTSSKYVSACLANDSNKRGAMRYSNLFTDLEAISSYISQKTIIRIRCGFECKNHWFDFEEIQLSQVVEVQHLKKFQHRHV